jgi:putative membrane-bound dehydrogenase-like protein
MMQPSLLRCWSLASWLLALGCVQPILADQPVTTGPQTEQRFPPLKVPAGFQARLFACDPLIEYPSAIARGPKSSSLFVAIDYLTGLGTDIVRRDEIRLIEDTDGDGYADQATVHADGFNSIQGLTYHDGVVYAMHSPYLTALRDTDGDGRADQRHNLLSGLGLAPEDNPMRLHCANGLVMGHDGWLYLALGDHGCDVPRPEGDRLVHHGGGILRCRPDGRDLHVFASGLRNIYDVALDDELNVFVRDNENDGGTYKIRVCHSFHGADHGYPYLYEEHPGEALPPLADLGLGSSAGGVCYLERHFPSEYRGNLLFCEWGKSIVRYQPERGGSTFAPLAEREFATGAANDPYGFKPTDIAVQRDGTLMVSDWADGQRPKRGRGRIYQITYTGEGASAAPPAASTPPADSASWLASLDSESYYERCEAQAAIQQEGAAGLVMLKGALGRNRLGPRGRRHGIWILATLGGAEAIADLLLLAESDREPGVRIQALRAIADLADPVLVQHRLDPGPGDAELAARLAGLGKGQDRGVLLEVIIALGRLRWPGTAAWLQENVQQPDAALSHAAMRALRRSKNWPAVLRLLDKPASDPLRTIAARAVAEQFDTAVVDGLIRRLHDEPDAAIRQQSAEALSRVYQRPGNWVYWGYRPPARPVNSVAWERSAAIADALDRVLSDPDRTMRVAALRHMQREQVPVKLASLGRWLGDEHDPVRVTAILASLANYPESESRPFLEVAIRDSAHSPANRVSALELYCRGIDESDAQRLHRLAQALEDGSVLADALRRLGRYPKIQSAMLLTSKLTSPEPAVRGAAIEALGELRASVARGSLLTLLADAEAQVRRAAAGAAGKLAAREAIEPLLKLAAHDETDVRRASLDSLRLLQEPRAVPLAVAALGDRQLELPALQCLLDLGGPEQATAVAAVAKQNPSAEVLSIAIRALTTWRDRGGLTAAQQLNLDQAVAEIHGTGGVIVRWNARGPIPAQDAPPIIARFATAGSEVDTAVWQTHFATGTEARVLLNSLGGAKDDLWLAISDLAVPESTAVEFLGSMSGSLEIWLNGRSQYRRDEPSSLRSDSDRFAATLAKGTNRLLVAMKPAGSPVEFHLRFRRKSASVDHERLTRIALARAGNPDRGRAVFLNVEKSQCLKCHRLGDQGETTGPELTGVGSRFSRIYLVESILEPSRNIAPSFGTLSVLLQDGRVLNGVKTAETASALTLVDNQGQKHLLSKAEIDQQRTSPVSTMPDGLEKRLTEAEFVDLLAFLLSSTAIRTP